MNEPGTLVVFFDYVDPVSFILFQHLRKMEDFGVGAVAHMPLELNPPPHPLMDPEGPEYMIRWEVARPHLQELELVLQPPWIVPWTRKAHELAAHARENNCFEEVHETLFLAYLSEGLDIGRIDVLVDLAGRLGLDPREAKAVLDVDRYRDEVEQSRAWSTTAGVTTPPGLHLNGRTYVGDPNVEALVRFVSSDPQCDST